MHVGCDLKGMAESQSQDGHKQILVWGGPGNAVRRVQGAQEAHVRQLEAKLPRRRRERLGVTRGPVLQPRSCKQYCNRKRIAQRSTLGYNPRGNSVVGRIMRYLNFAAMRSLKDSEYAEWNHEFSSMAAGWNSHHVRTMGCTPYQAMHGFPMRTHASTVLEPQESKAAEPEEISEQLLEAKSSVTGSTRGGRKVSAAEGEAKAPAAQASTLSPTTSTCPADPYDLEINSFVAVIEDPSSPNFEIAKVVSRTGDCVTLHIYGTHAGRNSLRTAKYKPLWMVPADQQVGGESQVQYNPPHSDPAIPIDGNGRSTRVRHEPPTRAR